MIPSYLFSVLIAITLFYSSLAAEQIPLTDPRLEKGSLNSLDHPRHNTDIAHLRIDFSTPGAANTTKNILGDITDANRQYPFDRIRNITVSGYSGLGNWPLVTKVFSKVLNLETVHWHNEEPIPSHILRSLEKNSPSCRLYYTLHFSWRNKDLLSRPAGPIEYLERLWINFWKESHNSINWSTNLYSLKASIMYGGQDNVHDLATVFDIITSAPKLRELDLRLSREGCVLANTAWSFDFRSHPSTRFPSLEVVRLNGYSLEDSPSGSLTSYWTELWASIRDFFSGKERMALPPGVMDPLIQQELIVQNNTNLDTWMKRMDWSHVHALEISQPSDHVLNVLEGDALPALRNLVVSRKYPGYDRDRVMEFITKTAQPLEAFSLIRFDLDPADEFISNANLCRELKSFTFRPNDENTLPIHDNMLHHILATSPKLESVDVAVERQADIAWHERPWKEFLYCHTLKHLTLRFPSPDGPEIDYTYWPEHEPDPIINDERNLALFKKMRKLKHGAELESVKFYVGDWENRNLMTQAPRGNFRVGFYSCFIAEGEEKCEGNQVIQR